MRLCFVLVLGPPVLVLVLHVLVLVLVLAPLVLVLVLDDLVLATRLRGTRRRLSFHAANRKQPGRVLRNGNVIL